jgi:hypothetical protein
MGLRWVIGPSSAQAERADCGVSLAGIRKGGCVDLVIHTDGDPAFVEPVAALRVVYLPHPADAPGAPDLGSDLEALHEGAPFKAEATAEQLGQGGALTVQVPGVAPGAYWVQTLIGYADADAEGSPDGQPVA